MNELGEAGELNEALARRWGISGRSVFTMASDLFPTTTADQRAMDPEILYLAGARRCSVQNGLAALAGNVSIVGLFSPPAGNTLCVLERLYIRAAAATQLLLTSESPGVTPLTATSTGILHDSRWLGARSTGLTGTRQQAAASGSVQAVIEVPAGQTSLDIPWEHVIAPNGNFMVQTVAQNVTLNVTFVWRERRLTEWEKRSG